MALLLGAVASAPSLFNAPVYDDELLIFSNRFVQDPSHWLEGLTTDFFHASNLPAGHGGYYRPVMKVAFMAQFAAFGHGVLGYHLVGMAGFLLAIALGASVARRLGLSREASVVGAALGATHPVFASALGPITSQSDIFAAAGMLGCASAYLRAYAEPRARDGMPGAVARKPEPRWLGLALLAATLALGCKESAALTPAVIACIALARPGVALRTREQLTRIVRDVALFCIPIVSYVLARVAAHVLPVSEARSGGSLAALATASKLLCSSTLRALFPNAWLPLLHPLRPTGSLADLATWVLPALVLATASCVAFLCKPGLRPWLALFFAPLAPVVLAESMIHTGSATACVTLPDRWLVLPAIIGSQAVACAFVFARDAVRAPLRALVTVGLAIYLTVQMALTLEEMASYRTENAQVIHIAGLYREQGISAPFARETMLGADAIRAEAAGDAKAAARAYAALAELRPNDVVNRYNLAVMLMRSGDLPAAYDAAYLAYHGESRDGALRLTPEDSANRRRPERAYLLARLAEQVGEQDNAIRYFRECLAMRPDFPGAREALSRLTRP